MKKYANSVVYEKKAKIFLKPVTFRIVFRLLNIGKQKTLTKNAEVAMIKYIFQCLTTKYCDFDGRASLAEFFSFWLFAFVLLYLFVSPIEMVNDKNIKSLLTIFGGMTLCFLFFPCLAVTVRRLHDGDVSGWWLLLAFGPSIVIVFLLVILGWHERNCLVDNKYGPALPENTGKWNEDDESEDEKK